MNFSFRNYYNKIGTKYNGIVWDERPNDETLKNVTPKSTQIPATFINLELHKTYYAALCHSWDPKEGLQFVLDTSKLKVNIISQNEFSDDLFLPQPLTPHGQISVRMQLHTKRINDPNVEDDKIEFNHHWHIVDLQTLNDNITDNVTVFVKGSETYQLQ